MDWHKAVVQTKNPQSKEIEEAAAPWKLGQQSHLEMKPAVSDLQKLWKKTKVP
jgi:hypothetical protein